MTTHLMQLTPHRGCVCVVIDEHVSLSRFTSVRMKCIPLLFPAITYPRSEVATLIGNRIRLTSVNVQFTLKIRSTGSHSPLSCSSSIFKDIFESRIKSSPKSILFFCLKSCHSGIHAVTRSVASSGIPHSRYWMNYAMMSSSSHTAEA